MQQPTISIRNWSKYQHYKRRRPLWVKLYNDLLDDPAFIHLPDSSKFHLVGLFLIASRTDNKIPADPEYLKLVLHSVETPDLITLAKNGWFLESASAFSKYASSERERETDSGLSSGSLPSGDPLQKDLPAILELAPPIPKTNGQEHHWFDKWWAAYRQGIAPRPMREKHKAKAEWSAVKAESQGERMLAKLERQISYRSNLASSNQFCPPLPDPIRYLRRKLWREELQ